MVSKLKLLILFLFFSHGAIGQINVDSLIVLSRAKDVNSTALIRKMVYRNSTVEIKKGAKGFAKPNSKINVYESKSLEKIPLVETLPGFIRTEINGNDLYFKAVDYVSNSISSPLIDSLTSHFIESSQRIKIVGVDVKILNEITKLTYSFDIGVKVDTAFESKTNVSLSKQDFLFQGQTGTYYKLMIPSLTNDPVYVSRKQVDSKILYFYKDVIKKFVPHDHVKFFSIDNKHYAASPGKFVSSFNSGGYSSTTYRNGNTYITTTNYNGQTTTSTYIIDY